MIRMFYEFKFDEGYITFTKFKKEKAHALFEMIKKYKSTKKQPVQITNETCQLEAFAVGRFVNTDGTVSLSVLKYNPVLGTSEVQETVVVPKIKANVEMRKLLLKYPLLD